MRVEIIVIGGGASGLMAAYAAARTSVEAGSDARVLLFEKMPRVGRKIMITGKGRCNFTNLKEWNEFSAHIQSKANFVKSAFYNFTSADAIDFFEGYGMRTIVERGDRAFPASYHASDAVDTLVRAVQRYGVSIQTACEVRSVSVSADGFKVEYEGGTHICRKLILATGGLSYPGTGSTGDGYGWAQSLGHSLRPCFPSLTAVVPRGYKLDDEIVSEFKGHIHRSSPLSEFGRMLNGIQLKNVGVVLEIEGSEAASETGDLDFTDGGIEGPIGFQVSRKAVKAMTNGSKVSLKVLVNPLSPVREREEWKFDIAGFVGYERAVVTAGGVCVDEVLPKTMESRIVPGLYFCGEVLDIDADTGGYNLQLAFCTGALAGLNAYKSLP